MLSGLRQWFRTVLVIYSCIALVGCMTPRAIEYAEGRGKAETRHWNIAAITFAAIRDDRYVRICVSLAGAAGATETEISVDLQQIAEQLDSQDGIIGGLKDGVNTESAICGHELHEDEHELPVAVVHSTATDVVEALHAFYQQTPDRPVAGLLHMESESYLVLGAMPGLYEGLDGHALGPYTETVQHYHPSIFLLLPIAVAFDAALIAVMVVMIVICAIPLFLPFCLPFMMAAGAIENADPGSYEDWQAEEDEEDLFE